MKRSHINDIMSAADDLIRSHGFNLPPFAYWSVDEFRARKDEAKPIIDGRCGWDIVAKAARMNIGVIASIGAASQLAADVARKANISLVTFVKDGKATLIGPVEGRFEAKD